MKEIPCFCLKIVTFLFLVQSDTCLVQAKSTQIILTMPDRSIKVFEASSGEDGALKCQDGNDKTSSARSCSVNNIYDMHLG